jgi:hypothetical protein
MFFGCPARGEKNDLKSIITALTPLLYHKHIKQPTASHKFIAGDFFLERTTGGGYNNPKEFCRRRT